MNTQRIVWIVSGLGLGLLTGCPGTGGGGGGNVNRNTVRNANTGGNGNLNANANINQNAGPNANGNINAPANANANANVNANANINLNAAATTLFVANDIGGGGSVASYAITAATSGDVTPATLLTGVMTGISSPLDLLVDQSGSLLVLNFVGQYLTIYDGAVTATGNTEFSRALVGAMALQGTPNSLALSPGGNLLYVANFADSIEVYDMAGTPGLMGNRSPVRTITSAAMIGPLGLDFDEGDTLYVANTGMGGNPNILAFGSAGTLTGDSPARVITITANPAIFAASLVDVVVDAQDRLYVLNSSQQRVFSFNSAAGLMGMATPNATLTVDGAMELSGVAVDASGAGYLTDRLANRVYIFANLATRNGTLAADRTISGPATQLNNPVELFLLEP